MFSMLNLLELFAVGKLTTLAYSKLTPARQDVTESNSSLNDLPVELIGEIIHHLRHHDTTLRSCSLVCRTWVPLSRYYLFYRIHLNHSNVSAFLALLKSESGSSTGAFVQQVAIYREQSHPPWMKEILPVLSSYLHPTSLYLNIQNSFQGDAFFESQEFQLYREDLSVFPDVFQETVRLSLSLDCNSFEEGGLLICAFPLLETLELHGDWFLARKPYVPSNPPQLPSHVRSISCSQGGSPFFLWLLRQPHPPSVSSLSLRDTYLTETVTSYLQTLGGTLRHLSFELNFHQSTSNLIDVSRNVGLRSIALYSQIYVITIAFQLLSQVCSTDIEKVEIGLSEHAFTLNLMDLGPPELWSRLDTLLSTPRFSKLREVMIVIPSISFHKIRNLLPLSNTRGILCVPSREPISVYIALSLYVHAF
jgi:hypothetical protein